MDGFLLFVACVALWVGFMYMLDKLGVFSIKRAFSNEGRVDISTLQWGPLNPALVCPHCQKQSFVRTKPTTKKAGVSGGKATAAVLTGGLSLLAVGLSRKEAMTQAHCDHCMSDWAF